MLSGREDEVEAFDFDRLPPCEGMHILFDSLVREPFRTAHTTEPMELGSALTTIKSFV